MQLSMRLNITSLYILIVINYIIFVIDLVLQIDLSFLYLHHQNPQFYQFLSSAFCHADFNHLSGNMFFLYFFGRLSSDELSNKTVVIIYFLTAILSNFGQWFILEKHSISLGASAVVFSFFTMSILLKVKSKWHSIIDILVLGPFLLSQLLSEVNSYGNQDHIGHLAHILGACIGIIFYFLIKKRILGF